MALGQSPEANGMSRPHTFEGGAICHDVIPSHILVDEVRGNPTVRERNAHRSRWCPFIRLDSSNRKPHLLKPALYLNAPLIIANPRKDRGIRAKRLGVIGKVSRGATQLRPIRQQIPQNFTNANYVKTHETDCQCKRTP